MIKDKTHLYYFSAPFDMIDMSGVMHHPQYLVLCERARTKGLKEAGYPFQDFLKVGLGLVLRQNECQYFKPVFLDDEMIILSHTELAEGFKIKLVQRFVAASSLPAELSGNSFVDTARLAQVELPIIYSLHLTLVSVTLQPVKPTPLPQAFLTKMGFPPKSNG